MSKYLELFKGSFNDSINEKTKLENKPYIGYSLTEGKMVYTVVPKPVTGPADNEIWYTSKDGNIVTPYDTNVFGTNIVSNTYESGRGIITFGASLTGIGPAAFQECSSIISIILPNSIDCIGIAAFSYCSSLTSITIPSKVEEILMGCFSTCSSLTSITFKGTMEQWNTIEKGQGWNEYCPEITVHCADGDIIIPANN